MTAEAETDFNLMPREQRLANVWIAAWCLTAGLCTPTLVDELMNSGEASMAACLFGLVNLWLIPLVSTTALYGPALVSRLIDARRADLRERVSHGLVVGSAAIGVLAILPAIGFAALLSAEALR